MHGLKKAVLIFCFALLSAPLGGCESVDTATLGMKNKIASMDFSMPDLSLWDKNKDGANDDAAATPEETIVAVAETASEAVPCPAVSVIGELNAMHQFTDPGKPSSGSRISSIRMTDLKTGCKRNRNNLAIDMDIVFEGTLGPRARIWNTDKPSFAYPYFVALTRPDGEIIAKEVFAATMSYDKNQEAVLHTESLRQIIPAGNASDMPGSILIGFQLTDDELAYNRAPVDAAPQPDQIQPFAVETSAGTETPPAPAVPKPKPTIAAAVEPQPQAAPVATVEEEPAPEIQDITATD